MEKFYSKAFIVFILSSFTVIYAFDCKDILHKKLCEELNGCNYNDEKSECTGEINEPKCKFTHCFYVYNPKNTSKEEGEGTLAEPYTHIEQAFKKSDLKIIIINPSSHQHQYTFNMVIDSKERDKFTLTTLFKESNPVEVIPPKDEILFNGVYEKGYELFIQNIIFIRKQLLYKYIIRLNNGGLTLRNVGFKNIIDNFIVFTEEASIDIDGLWLKNTPAKFYFLQDEDLTITLKNVSIIDMSQPYRGIQLTSNNITLEDIYVQNITMENKTYFSPDTSMGFHIFKTYRLNKDLHSLSIKNVIMKDLNLARPFQIQDFLTINFQNISLFNIFHSQSGGLIDVIGVDNQESELFLNNIKVLNCKVNEHVFSYSRGIIEAKDITIENLTKIEGKFNPYFNYFTPGICFFLNQVSGNLSKMKIFTVNYNCITQKDSKKFQIDRSIFDNQKLEYSENDQKSQIGVTWISIQALESDSINNISSNIFHHNKVSPEKGGAIYFNLGTQTNVNLIKDNIIIGTTAKKGGGIAVDNYGQNSLLYQNLQFISTTAYQDGGAIYSSNIAGNKVPSDSQVIFLGLSTLNCVAKNQGGAFKLTEGVIHIFGRNNFVGNFAQYGGAFSVIAQEQFVDEKNIYAYNQAAIFGGRSFDLNSSYHISSKQAIQVQNTDPNSVIDYQNTSIGFNVSVYKFKDGVLRLNSQTDPQFLIVNGQVELEETKIVKQQYSGKKELQIIPGHGLPKLIIIEALDQDGKVTNLLDKFGFVASLISQNKSASILGDESQVISGSITKFQNGRAYFWNNIILGGLNNSKQILHIKANAENSDIFKDLNLELYFSQEIQFIECQLGDKFINETNTCSQCPEGSYTLDDPYDEQTSCLKCPKNLICLGGAFIGPIKGYYRYDNSSTKVFECPSEELCIGAQLKDESFSQSGFCEYPHKGNLCAGCISGYTRILSSYECIQCSNSFRYYIKLLQVVLTQLAIVIISLSFKFSQTESIKRGFGEDDEEAKRAIDIQLTSQTAVKILLNFNLTVAIINNYKIDWPPILEGLQSLFKDLVPSAGKDFSVECILQSFDLSKATIFYLNFLNLVIEPISLFLIISIGYRILSLIFRNRFKNQKSTYRAIFILVGFFFQPTIVLESLQMFYCINLGEYDSPEYFLSQDPNIQCWNAQHLTWSLSTALPAFLIWGVILPILLFRKVKESFKNEGWQETLQQYSFIIGGYKDKFYWWEFVVMLRKILVVLILVTLNGLYAQGQILVTGIVLTIAAMIHTSYQPYKNEDLNHLETVSLSATVGMTVCEIYFTSISNQQINTPLNTILSFCSLIVIVYLITRGFMLYYRHLKIKAGKLKEKLKKLQSKDLQSGNNSINNSSMNSTQTDMELVSVDMKL